MSKDLFLPASAFNIQRERDEKFKRSRKKEMLSDQDVVRKDAKKKSNRNGQTQRVVKGKRTQETEMMSSERM
jgi:hypothetical protein